MSLVGTEKPPFGCVPSASGGVTCFSRRETKEFTERYSSTSVTSRQGGKPSTKASAVHSLPLQTHLA
jgi:hypothetical protein